MAGVTTTVKVAHVRLSHSRMFFVAAYPRETQEMVFDAHARAFAFFGGVCTRGIYDNISTAVDAVFLGKERRFNRRFCRSEEHTSELQSLMRISYAVFCLKKKKSTKKT